MSRLDRSRVLFGLLLSATALSFASRSINLQMAARAQTNAQDKLALILPQTGHAGIITSLAYSPDGRTLASGSADRTIRIWSLEAGITIKTLSKHSGSVDSIEFSPDGRLLASGSGDGVVKLWDVATAREIWSSVSLAPIRGTAGPPVLVPGIVGIASVKFSPDGRLLASASLESIRLWDVQSGRELRTLNAAKEVSSISFSPDGKVLAVGNGAGELRLWEVASGKLVRLFKAHLDWIGSIAFAPDGKSVASASSDSSIRLWDISGNSLRTLSGHTSAVSSVGFSPDGKTLVSGSEDKAVKLWDVATGAELRTLKDQSQGITAVTFSPDGRSIASSSKDRTIDIWNVSDGSLRKTLRGHAHPVLSVAFNPDHTLLASGSDDSIIRIWDLKQGQLIRSLSGHTNVVTSVAFSADGNTLASGSADDTVRLWDVATGAAVHTLLGHSVWVASVAFSPDGKVLASGGENIKLWDVKTGAELFTLTGHSSDINCVAFSPDSKTLASGSDDHQVKLWDITRGSELRSFLGHSSPVWSVVFSPDGKSLASAGDDMKVNIWDVATGRVLARLEEDSPALSLDFTADGKTLASGRGDGMITLWDVKSADKVESFRAHSRSVSALAFSTDGKLASGSEDGAIKLWRANNGKELGTLIGVDEKDWIVADDELRVDATPKSQRFMYWSVDDDLISFDQLKERFFEPGLLSKLSGLSKGPLRDVGKFEKPRLNPDVKFEPLAQGSSNLTVALTNRGGGIGRVHVFVNGKEFLNDARDEKVRRNPNVAKATLNIDLSKATGVVAGQENHIKVVAWNVENYISSRGAELVWTPDGPARRSPPEVYAIVGGISHYAGAQLNLNFAASDAVDIANAIELGAKRMFGESKVHLDLLSTATDPRAIAPTKENFAKAFAAARKARPTDILIVYLAGHGITLRAGGGDTYYYLTQEARTADTAALSDSAVRKRELITSEELVDWIKQIPALKEVVILDTCAAGAAPANLVDKREASSDAIRAIDRLKDRTGAYVLMGSAVDASCYESSPYGQGLLTYALLQGMKGAALRNDEFIDVSKLFQYARDEVEQLARNIGGIQRPLIFSPKDDSFDVGQLTAADKLKIVLATPKPIVLRPAFINDGAGYDDLKLAASVRGALRAESVKASGEGGIVFVDADEMPSAVRPFGIYKVDGTRVRLKLNLVRDNLVIATVNVEGMAGEIDRFAALVAETIIQELSKTSRKSTRALDKKESTRLLTRLSRTGVDANSKLQSRHHADRATALSYDGLEKPQQSEKPSFMTTEVFNESSSTRSPNQSDKPSSFVVVRPAIHNAKPELGDDLKLQDEVLKHLKAWLKTRMIPLR